MESVLTQLHNASLQIYTSIVQTMMPWRLIAMLSISDILIVSRYVAESMTTDAGRFDNVGLCQLHTKQFCTQLTKAYVAKKSCISCLLLILLRICSRSVHLVHTTFRSISPCMQSQSIPCITHHQWCTYTVWCIKLRLIQ